MTERSWIVGKNGAWTDAAAWSGGSVPSASDDAIFAAAPVAGAPGYAVLLTTGAAVRSVTQRQPGVTLDVDGGTLGISGTYGLSAGTLALEGGTLAGGTLVMAGGVLLAGPGYLPGEARADTLSGLTVQGPLLLASQYADIQVVGGLRLTGPSGTQGTIGLQGDGDTLSIAGTQLLDHVSIGIGDPTPDYLGDALFADGPGGQTSTLTLGAHAAVAQTGNVATLAGAGDRGLVVNRGSITASVDGGTFTLRSLANAGQITVGAGGEALLASVSNAGTIRDQSGVVSVQGSLLNTGLISISGAGASYVADPYAIPGLVNDGLFSVSNGATASLGLYGYGWTNAGTLAVAGGLLSVGGDFTAAQLGRVQLSAGGTLGLAGTLANAGTLAIGAGSAIPALGLQAGGEIAGGVVADGGGGLLAQGGTLAGVTYRGALLAAQGARVTIVDGLSLTDSIGTRPGTLALTASGASVVWDSAQALDRATLLIGAASAPDPAPSILAAYGGPDVTLGGRLQVRQAGAYAQIGGTAGVFSSAATLTANVAGGQFTLGAAQFTNTGTIGISGGDTLTVASAEFTNAGLIVVGVGGALDLSLAGYVASGRPSPESFCNSGRIQMAGGSLAELTGGGVLSKVPLLNAAGGSVSGAGVIASQINNCGVIEARGGTLNLVQTVSGMGTLRVDTGATLAVGGVGAGQTAMFGGAGGVLGLQPACFLGAVDGFAAGDTLDLFNTVAVSAHFDGHDIDVALGSGAVWHLHTTTLEVGALSVAAGTHGDSLVRFAPAASFGLAVQTPTDVIDAIALLPAGHGV